MRAERGKAWGEESITEAGSMSRLWDDNREANMNRVLFISLHGEREVLQSKHLEDCIAEANRLNKERGYHAGVHVVECADGVRMTAADCKAAA